MLNRLLLLYDIIKQDWLLEVFAKLKELITLIPILLQ